MQLESITELLALPNYKVVRLLPSDKSEHFHVLLEQVKGTPLVCSGCGRVHTGSIHSKTVVRGEDMPVSGRRVFLHVPKREIRCSEDGSIRVEAIAWIRGRFTRRFAEQIYRVTSITTNAEAGWFLGLDDEVVYRIDRGMLEELALSRLEVVGAPRHMSVDEVAWKKWHQYVTTVVDIERRAVIWNHEGRGKKVLERFYKAVGKQKCTGIEAVASDGARGYVDATEEHARQALIVLDPFHVKKYLNDAVDTVRKQELRKARQHHDTALEGMLHCNKRFILMQNKGSTKKRDLLERLSRLNQAVYQAMLLKEQFLGIYSTTDRKSAWANLKAWIVAALKSNIAAFVELGKKFFRKRHYILNYFLCNITTAISEGINNKIKRLKRMAYGYRDVKYFLLKIHQHCGLLNPRLST